MVCEVSDWKRSEDLQEFVWTGECGETKMQDMELYRLEVGILSLAWDVACRVFHLYFWAWRTLFGAGCRL